MVKGARIGIRCCGHCKPQFTVKVETVFEASHIPLHQWLQAVYLMSSSRKGISSHQLMKPCLRPLQTRGFNLEATHMTDPAKLSTLIAILAMAAGVAYKTGLWALGGQPRRCKAHGRPARSLFALGLNALRKLCASRTFAQSLQVLLDLLIGSSMESLVYSEM